MKPKGKDGNEIIEEIKGENLCRYGENLYTKNKSIILPLVKCWMFLR